MNGNIQLKCSNYVAFSHFHGEAVNNIGKSIIPNKKITPHKLRSTYGTNLYRETGDIYLVADVLGHADVNTTKKHYAKSDDSRRRMAASAVVLREDI